MEDLSTQKLWMRVVQIVTLQIVFLLVVTSVSPELAFLAGWSIILFGWLYTLLITNYLVKHHLPQELIKDIKYKILCWLIIGGSIYVLLPYINSKIVFDMM